MVNFLSPTFTVLPKAARLRQPSSGLAPEEESGLLKSIGSGALSGLAAAGNLIDVPWSMGRDILAGENPFDQLLTPFSPENRVWGRELLERGGVLGPNKPGFDWGDVAGVAVDLADPFLLPLSMPSRALGLGGQALKNAGLLQKTHLAKVATDLLGKKLGRSVGWREAQQMLKPADVLGSIKSTEVAKVARSSFDDAAKHLGHSGENLLNQPIGGLLGLGKPFMAPSVTVGREGGVGQTIARAMDVAGEGIRLGKYSPLRPLANLFSRAGWGARTADGFVAHNRALHLDEGAIATGRGFSNEVDDLIAKAGISPDEAGIDRIWELVEGVTKPSSEAEVVLAERFRSANQRALLVSRTYGMRHGALDDPADIEHAFRQITRLKKLPDGKRQVLGVTGKEDLARGLYLKGWTGGTGDVRKAARMLAPLVRKDKSASVIEQALKQAIDDGTIRGIVDIAEKGGKPISRLPAIAKAFKKFDPDILDTGIFGNYPAFDFEKWAVSQAMKEGHAQTILETLAGRGRDASPILKGANDIAREESVSLKRFVEKLSLHHGGVDAYGAPTRSHFYDRLGEALGMTRPGGDVLTPEAFGALRKMRVEKRLAKDLAAVMEGWGKTPGAVSEPLMIWDSLQNIWKASVTGPWPAFQFRNRLGGAVQEMLRGAFSGKWSKAVNGLVKGQNPAVFKEHPLVRKLAVERGMDAAKLTNQEAGDFARQLLRQHNVVSAHAGEALQRVGQAGAQVTTSPEGWLAQFPGGGLRGKYDPLTAGKIARTFAGMEPGTRWTRGATARGFLGETETTFPILKGGELVGARVETMNRAPGWFKETARGVNPVEAAKRVGEAQVRYENRFYTPFEQGLLRVFPFGKFFKGQASYVSKELLGRPAGPMGTVIRGTTRARGEGITPEYVQQTAAVPIPEGTPGIGPQKGGDLRYLAGFGLMHEDPLQMLGGGVSGGIAELISRSSPAIKGPIEWATGRSFFQRGPEGGRELTEMDPTLGRIGRNVQQLISGERGRTEAYKLPLWVEQLSANLPTSRLTTTARTLTDPRKTITSDVPIPGPAAALNLLTGARIVDVPEAAQEAILREAVTQRLRKTGVAKVFERTYVPKETLEQIPPDVRKDAEQMQALLNLLAERAQKRARGETLEPIGGGLSTTRTW